MTSAFSERVVGVPDPEDDCLVVWDVIKENEAPKQLVPGGEYFVLKRTEPDSWTGIPESAISLQTLRSCLRCCAPGYSGRAVVTHEPPRA